MGSGHILVYAFDVLMQIYTSAGWDQREAAQSILKNNLFGLDIDDRAAQLAYFAVMMKARQYDRRLFTRGIQPNIYSIQESNGINRNQLQFFGWSMSEVERNTALTQLEYLLDTFRDAKEYGSILNVDMLDWGLLYRFVGTVDYSDQISMDELNLEDTKDALWNLVELGAVLAQKYDVVVTNPPYMGASGMNARLAEHVKLNYPNTKSDMSTIFMEKTVKMCNKTGYMSMINIPVWMFLSSYERLREILITQNTFTNMAHFGRGVFGSDFGTTAFVIAKAHINGYKGTYCRLFEKQGAVDSVETKEKWFLEGMGRFVADQSIFVKIPGVPVAYWASQSIMKAFDNEFISSYAISNGQNITGNNNIYLRLFWEVDYRNIKNEYWAKCARGGGYRKYYGNDDNLILWTPKARQHYKNDSIARIVPEVLRFRSGITWSYITSGKPSFRRLLENELFEKAGTSIFVNDVAWINGLLGLLNSVVAKELLQIISPTINYQVRDIFSMPVAKKVLASNYINYLVNQNTDIEKMEWDSYETSWDFKRSPLV
jgi:eco57I restriction endonuclease